MAAIFKMATKTKFSYVAKKTLVRLKTWPIRLCIFIDFGLEKKKYLEAPKLKIVAQFKMAPKFDLLLKPTNRLFSQFFLLYRLFKYLILCKNFFLKNSRWHTNSKWRFFGIFFSRLASKLKQTRDCQI
jgi:hypothetical protein